MKDAYRDFMCAIAESLNKHGVKYKIFGGSIVVLFNIDRETNDIDVAIKSSVENTEKLIDALADCGYADRDFISMQVYGEDNKVGENMYSTCYLESTNPEWAEYHIDLMFNIGEHTYDNLQSETFELDGIPVEIVKPREVIRMKANIVPRPREKDIGDIEFLAEMLGLDPETGRKKEVKLQKSSLFQRLGKRRK